MRASVEDMIWEMRANYGFNSPRVFKAMLQVSRHEFIEKKYKNIAYQDSPISIGYGQTISQPYTVAFMTDLLLSKRKSEGKKVLEIGTGSGYQAAILSKLFEEVYTVEVIPDLVEIAQKTLRRLKYKNIFIKLGSGQWGWREHAPYDAIIITASIEKKIPAELFNQLKVGGILVAPIGREDGSVMTRYIKKPKNKYKKEEYGVFYFVPFIEGEVLK